VLIAHCVAGEYAVGQVYLPRDETLRHKARTIIDNAVAALGHDFIAWRLVPTNNRSLGASALSTEPVIEQVGSARGVVGSQERGCTCSTWSPSVCLSEFGALVTS
jgi:glutamate synthase domain-containing protein 1